MLPVQKRKENNGRHLSSDVVLSVQGTSALVSSVEAILDSYMEGAAEKKDDKERNIRLEVKAHGAVKTELRPFMPLTHHLSDKKSDKAWIYI